MKIDVAVQSFKKPESLLYSLLSLKEFSQNRIDTVWINDDKSPPWIADFYRSPAFKDALNPWRIRVRTNRKRMGWWYAPVRGLHPRGAYDRYSLLRPLYFLLKSRARRADRNDVRYQWAIDHTDKDFIFLIHDDITFFDDVTSLYLRSISEIINPAIVGDLGQCWRCEYASAGCTPTKVLQRSLPSAAWPNASTKGGNPWPCRVNEWSALLSVAAAREMEAKHQVLFGNYDQGGDIGAYWFNLAHKDGYGFSDPLPASDMRRKYYFHADGASGHSVWVDQGTGKRPYDAAELRRRLLKDFGFVWPDSP